MERDISSDESSGKEEEEGVEESKGETKRDSVTFESWRTLEPTQRNFIKEIIEKLAKYKNKPEFVKDIIEHFQRDRRGSAEPEALTILRKILKKLDAEIIGNGAYGIVFGNRALAIKAIHITQWHDGFNDGITNSFTRDPFMAIYASACGFGVPVHRVDIIGNVVYTSMDRMIPFEATEKLLSGEDAYVMRDVFRNIDLMTELIFRVCAMAEHSSKYLLHMDMKTENIVFKRNHTSGKFEPHLIDYGLSSVSQQIRLFEKRRVETHTCVQKEIEVMKRFGYASETCSLSFKDFKNANQAYFLAHTLIPLISIAVLMKGSSRNVLSNEEVGKSFNFVDSGGKVIKHKTVRKLISKGRFSFLKRSAILSSGIEIDPFLKEIVDAIDLHVRERLENSIPTTLLSIAARSTHASKAVKEAAKNVFEHVSSHVSYSLKNRVVEANVRSASEISKAIRTCTDLNFLNSERDLVSKLDADEAFDLSFELILSNVNFRVLEMCPSSEAVIKSSVKQTLVEYFKPYRRAVESGVLFDVTLAAVHAMCELVEHQFNASFPAGKKHHELSKRVSPLGFSVVLSAAVIMYFVHELAMFDVNILKKTDNLCIAVKTR